MESPPATDHPLEFFVRAAVNWLRLGVETTGATISASVRWWPWGNSSARF